MGDAKQSVGRTASEVEYLLCSLQTLVGVSATCTQISVKCIHLPSPRRICNRSCLTVCKQLYAKTSERIYMKFLEKVGNGPVNKWLNFGGDPDHGSGSESRHW